MSWHIQSAALRDYADGSIEATQQFSVEAHLVSCAVCRTGLSYYTDKAALDRTWDAIAAETAAPAPNVIERTLLRIGVSDHNARLLAATPSLRWSWLLAVGVVLSIAVVVAHGAADGYVFFLALAPLLPLAGIAAAYGPGVDPTYEIGVAAPLRSFKLLLLRAIAVLASTMALGMIAALFLPEVGWATAAWLLPSLGLVTSSLAISTIVHPMRAATLVAGAWVAAVSAAAWAASGDVAIRTVFGGDLQIALLSVTLGAGLFLLVRRDEFERGEHR